MQQHSRRGLVKALKYGVLIPLAAIVIVLNVLSWTDGASWAQQASQYTPELIILGFAAILGVQALQPKTAPAK